MENRILFGEFIALNRHKVGLSLRDFSKSISLSSAYISNMERGKRAAPCKDVLIKMARVLSLTDEEAEHFYDLAAKTRPSIPVPADLMDYINDDDKLKVFLRKAKSLGKTGDDLLKLL